ncbi:hypothetical protein PR048_001447 [Dryococelus australis]|uniref:Uncharacterized protein n=1 Tax=Dryococelus australis TaxID=614101 RepID=A0ABQ9IHD6_9NEOP|nr:hypothetical protein PR048_001447 [Dryococelus australis]
MMLLVVHQEFFIVFKVEKCLSVWLRTCNTLADDFNSIHTHTQRKRGKEVYGTRMQRSATYLVRVAPSLEAVHEVEAGAVVGSGGAPGPAVVARPPGVGVEAAAAVLAAPQVGGALCSYLRAEARRAADVNGGAAPRVLVVEATAVGGRTTSAAERACPVCVGVDARVLPLPHGAAALGADPGAAARGEEDLQTYLEFLFPNFRSFVQEAQWHRRLVDEVRRRQHCRYSCGDEENYHQLAICRSEMAGSLVNYLEGLYRPAGRLFYYLEGLYRHLCQKHHSGKPVTGQEIQLDAQLAPCPRSTWAPFFTIPRAFRRSCSIDSSSLTSSPASFSNCKRFALDRRCTQAVDIVHKKTNISAGTHDRCKQLVQKCKIADLGVIMKRKWPGGLYTRTREGRLLVTREVLAHLSGGGSGAIGGLPPDSPVGPRDYRGEQIVTCDPPTKTYQVRLPEETLSDFRMWERCRTMLLVASSQVLVLHDSSSRDSEGCEVRSYKQVGIAVKPVVSYLHEHWWCVDVQVVSDGLVSLYWAAEAKKELAAVLVWQLEAGRVAVRLHRHYRSQLRHFMVYNTTNKPLHSPRNFIGLLVISP